MYFTFNFSVKRNVAIVALIVIFSDIHNLTCLFTVFGLVVDLAQVKAMVKSPPRFQVQIPVSC